MDATKVGQALVTLALISRQMGHSDIRCTARDYLGPHATGDDDLERLFVLAAVTGMDPAELLPDDAECIEALGSVPMHSLSSGSEEGQLPIVRPVLLQVPDGGGE